MCRILPIALLLIRLSATNAQLPSEPKASLRFSAGFDALSPNTKSYAASINYLSFASPIPLGVRLSAILRNEGEIWRNENSYEVAGLTGFSLRSESMLFSVLSGISAVYFRYNDRRAKNGAQFGSQYNAATINVYSVGLPFDISFLFQPKVVGIGLSVAGNLNRHRSTLSPAVSFGLVW